MVARRTVKFHHQNRHVECICLYEAAKFPITFCNVLRPFDAKEIYDLTINSNGCRARDVQFHELDRKLPLTCLTRLEFPVPLLQQ